MKSRKMFSLALAFIMSFLLISTQSALAVDKSKIISLPSIDGSTKNEYILSFAPSGTVEYTYNTYENYRLVGEKEEFDTVPNMVTVYLVPLSTLIMARDAGNIIPSYIYVGQNEPDNNIANMSYNETYEDFRPQYNISFVVPDTENYYFISVCDESGARKDNGFWIKAADNATKPETIYDPGIKTATPSTCNVQINGQSVSFDAYVIDGNNYMKLRDVAYALNGTGKQFEVTWDEENSDITTGSCVGQDHG